MSDGAILRRMSEISNAISALKSTASSLDSLKTNSVKHASSNYWAGTYKSGKYDHHVDKIDKDIRKAKQTVRDDVEHGIAKLHQLAGQLKKTRKSISC